MIQTKINFVRSLLICIECTFCRLIRHPEHLIGRHWYLSANWRSFIHHHLISESSVLRHRVLIVASTRIVLCSVSSCVVWVNVHMPALWTPVRDFNWNSLNGLRDQHMHRRTDQRTNTPNYALTFWSSVRRIPWKHRTPTRQTLWWQSPKNQRALITKFTAAHDINMGRLYGSS
jgi:hypothetical protein